MAIDKQTRAEILRLFLTEKWKVGAIARQLRVDRNTDDCIVAEASDAPAPETPRGGLSPFRDRAPGRNASEANQSHSSILPRPQHAARTVLLRRVRERPSHRQSSWPGAVDPGRGQRRTRFRRHSPPGSQPLGPLPVRPRCHHGRARPGELRGRDSLLLRSAGRCRGDLSSGRGRIPETHDGAGTGSCGRRPSSNPARNR